MFLPAILILKNNSPSFRCHDTDKDPSPETLALLDTYKSIASELTISSIAATYNQFPQTLDSSTSVVGTKLSKHQLLILGTPKQTRLKHRPFVISDSFRRALIKKREMEEDRLLNSLLGRQLISR